MGKTYQHRWFFSPGHVINIWSDKVISEWARLMGDCFLVIFTRSWDILVRSHSNPRTDCWISFWMFHICHPLDETMWNAAWHLHSFTSVPAQRHIIDHDLCGNFSSVPQLCLVLQCFVHATSIPQLFVSDTDHSCTIAFSSELQIFINAEGFCSHCSLLSMLQLFVHVAAFCPPCSFLSALQLIVCAAAFHPCCIFCPCCANCSASSTLQFLSVLQLFVCSSAVCPYAAVLHIADYCLWYDFYQPFFYWVLLTNE